MRLINVKTFKLEEFLDYKAPPYAILSHTWGSDAEELTIGEVELGRIDKPGIGSIKFRGSCQQAQKDSLGYVWIDTCCIDKTNSVELNEAINSMFRWYQRAAVCYAYLSDVPRDDDPRKLGSKFRTSRWFERGWTLQELLAPKDLKFYNSDWVCLGTKGKLKTSIGKITGIPRQILLGITELSNGSVAQRMSWAARRETKRQEDLAYCLLGIFGVTMPMIYGEGGDQAFLRLQEQIMKTTRDDSILAWGLNTKESHGSDPNSIDQGTPGKILATRPSDFANSGHIVYREQSGTYIRSLELSGGSLRLYLELLTTSVGGTVGLLSCGPEHDLQHVVGIPLVQTAPGAPDEYFRPDGSHASLQPITASSASPRLINIKNDSQHKILTKERRQYWLYDEDTFAEADLDLFDVNPISCWDKERAMIISTIAASDGTAQQTLAQFRHIEEECPDFVMLLEVRQEDTSTERQCHVMTCGKDTALDELAEKLQYVAKKACGIRSASNGLVHLRVALEHDQRQSVSTIKAELLSQPPDVTINITSELQKTDLILELVEIWEVKAQTKAKRLELEQEVEDKNKRLQQAGRERKMVEDELRRLEERRRILAEEEIRGAEEIRLLSETQAAVEEQQEHACKRWSQARKRWDELCHIDCGEDKYRLEGVDNTTLLHWAAGNGYVEMVQLLLDKGPNMAADIQNDKEMLYWAAENGYANIVQILLDQGADINVANTDGWTSLIVASSKGHVDVVRLLVEKSSDINIKDENARTALWYARQAGHKSIVQLLLRSDAIAYWRLQRTLEGHSNCVRSVAFSPDSTMLASGSDDKTIRVWDAATGVLRHTLQRHSSNVYSVAFSPDSTMLASGLHDNTVRIWDAATGVLRHTLQGHSNIVYSVAFSPDSTMLASGSYDNTVGIWDATTGVLRNTLLGHSSNVYSVAFSPDSTMLASGSDDKTVRVWDATTWVLRHTLQGHSSFVHSVAFSPDSTKLASGSGDNTIRVWDAATEVLRHTLQGHSSNVYSVAFSADSTMLASGSGDNTVRIWDAATGVLRHTLQGHSSIVNSVAFSPDSTMLASGSGDKTIRVWEW